MQPKRSTMDVCLSLAPLSNRRGFSLPCVLDGFKGSTVQWLPVLVLLSVRVPVVRPVPVGVCPASDDGATHNPDTFTGSHVRRCARLQPIAKNQDTRKKRHPKEGVRGVERCAPVHGISICFCVPDLPFRFVCRRV